MDPATLAASVTTFLAPYLIKAGKSLAEQAVEKLPDGVSQLWTYVTDKFKGKPAAEGAAQEIAATPDEPDNQEAFTLQLKKALKEDPSIMEELAALLQQGQEKVSGGAVASGGSVAAGAGGVAVQGDVSGNIILGNNNTVSANSPAKKRSS